MQEFLYQVLLPLPFDKAFTYKFIKPLHIGQIVSVTFNNRKIFGVVWEVIDKANIDNELREKVKSIFYDHNEILTSNHINFIKEVSAYNLIPLGLTLKMVLSGYKILPQLLTAKDEHISFNAIKLSSEQQEAFETLKNNLDNGFKVSVLHGVTGSGKTEVYLKLIEEVLKSGKQILVLLPEILLTMQLIKRFIERLKFKPTEWHSNLTPKKRGENWHLVYEGKTKFIVGARSSLFLPYKNLALIIVDEEHDPSFKQEEGPIYNARDMAILRAKLEQIPILLSSATPSIETEYNIKIKKYQHLLLKNRFGKSVLPQISVINLKEKFIDWLSPPLKEAIIDNFKKNKQTLLYLNRRGYAPITLCDNCRHKLQCPNCNFNLVEHKFKKVLQCHYCGYKQSQSAGCKNCGSTEKFHAIGPGVERIAEDINNLLPEARTAILSSDILNTRKKVDAVLKAIEDHEIDILVGTQMVTKGLHFPKLDLVGIIDADAGMLSGDIRALERTYQILHQVSGRAGRESEIGKVILQTLMPESQVIKNLSDWEQFTSYELNNRQISNMPPFSRLVLITLSGKSESEVISYAKALAKAKPESDKINVLGPSPSPLFLLKRHYRYRFIVIADKKINIQNFIKNWLDIVPLNKNITIKIDVDPINFM